VAVSPAAFLALGLIALRVAGKHMPAAGDFGRFSETPAIGLVGVFLLITFIGSLGEEAGWRGYALPQLQRRFSPLTATLILAPLWFLWHLPQFAIIATYRDFGPAAYIGMFLGLTCGAIVLSWLYNRSGGSILLVIVWHDVYNFVGATQAATGMLAAVVSTLIMVQGSSWPCLSCAPGAAVCPRSWGCHEPPPARRHLGCQPSGQPGAAAAAAQPGRTPARHPPRAHPLPRPITGQGAASCGR
jgi:membrane protease YdiL (CAAX protease family)